MTEQGLGRQGQASSRPLPSPGREASPRPLTASGNLRAIKPRAAHTARLLASPTGQLTRRYEANSPESSARRKPAATRPFGGSKGAGGEEEAEQHSGRAFSLHLPAEGGGRVSRPAAGIGPGGSRGCGAPWRPRGEPAPPPASGSGRRVLPCLIDVGALH